MALALTAGLVQAPVAGDEISDARSEAAGIADRIEDLQHDAEVLTEQFLDAQLARQQIDTRIDEAEARAARSGDHLDRVRGEARGVAVEAYVSGDGDVVASGLIGSGDATDVSRRRGYADAVGADSEDLMDELRGTEASAAADARDLADLQDAALRAEEDVAQSRERTEARVTELRDLEREVDGRLRRLVEAEQERRAAAAAARAAEAQARAERAAAEAAATAPTPAPPVVDTEQPAVEEAEAPASSAAPAPATRPTPAPAPAPASRPTPAPAPGPQSGAAAAIAAARSVMGTPYRWGGASPSQGFDCSGLVLWAWQHGGKSLPHSSRALYGMSAKIPVSQLQPGDLVFYNSPISHVGLYIGGGQMIHAPHSGSTVHIVSIYYWSALVGGGRI